MVTALRKRKTEAIAAAGSESGWTLPELLGVILLAAVLLLIGTLSVYRGKATADELACQDNMQAIHSALNIYWTKNRDTVTQEHTYPVDQAAFEQFLQDPAYFTEELRCPVDDDGTYHYQYSYDAATNPGPEGIAISCPVPYSGHGSL
jgi:type II secretory pathway pseudopilin PulG